ncbi:erythromycin esterase [Myxococcus stipitatus DSM 14675]|uniref:Erythromycin esterase n=1 Tax=Myxococcus stipitatus (strain DSM 14675 / JCM 12634 / Mx s8) TaxID=1278073 RepID=L7U8E5_MYXSD|nr:erythromycin esterase family protein [Myxococcus stipitatus]AGC43837.1 erythromycin esterase [Myxococcus stipitatus DSM 14675]
MRYLLLLLPLLAACASVPKGEAPQAAAPVSDVDRIVRDLCGKQVALLGEEAHHGSGRTVTFKVELVRRLVEECQFDAFFIEAGTYDFVNIAERLKAGEPVGEAMVATAIGGLWAHQEMAPLVPFLTQRLNAGTLVAGGLDDQLNRDTYAHRQMTSELLPLLEGARREACGEELERYMGWRYDDAHPYTVDTVGRVRGCFREMASALSRPRAAGGPRTQGYLQMVHSLDRFFERQAAGFSQASEKGRGGRDWTAYNGRARSMFTNLEWHLAQSPRPRKAIVWLATIHAAKDFRALDGDLREAVPFGSFVQARFGADAFVLGFSAHAGSYAPVSNKRTQVLEPARADSLEGWAFSGQATETRYLDASQLRDLGPRAARPISYAWMTGPWATVMDGLLVFREESPPNALVR